MRLRHAELLLLVTLCLFAGARPAAADKIYLLNNYPNEQAGGTLSGQITVLDTAVNDGLLAQAEIVSWAFTLTDATLPIPNTVTIDSTTTPNPDTFLTGTFPITATQILLPAPDVLVLCHVSVDGWYSLGVRSWKSDFAKEGIPCRSVIVSR